MQSFKLQFVFGLLVLFQLYFIEARFNPFKRNSLSPIEMRESASASTSIAIQRPSLALSQSELVPINLNSRSSSVPSLRGLSSTNSFNTAFSPAIMRESLHMEAAATLNRRSNTFLQRKISVDPKKYMNYIKNTGIVAGGVGGVITILGTFSKNNCTNNIGSIPPVLVTKKINPAIRNPIGSNWEEAETNGPHFSYLNTSKPIDFSNVTDESETTTATPITKYTATTTTTIIQYIYKNSSSIENPQAFRARIRTTIPTSIPTTTNITSNPMYIKTTTEKAYSTIASQENFKYFGKNYRPTQPRTNNKKQNDTIAGKNTKQDVAIETTTNRKSLKTTAVPKYALNISMHSSNASTTTTETDAIAGKNSIQDAAIDTTTNRTSIKTTAAPKYTLNISTQRTKIRNRIGSIDEDSDFI